MMTKKKNLHQWYSKLFGCTTVSCDEFLQKTRIHLHSISEILMTEMSNIFLLTSTTNALTISTSAKAFKLSRPGFPDRFKIDVH